MADDARLRALFAEHFAFIWRTARRLGLDDAAADDCAQETFVTAAKKLDLVTPGKERSFLLGTAMRLASNARRVAGRRIDRPAADEALVDVVVDPLPGPDEALDRRRARALLDRALDGLSEEHRVVLVLAELEAMSAPAIASLLDVPVGTVASRLRRARDDFGKNVRRLQLSAAPAVRRVEGSSAS